MNGLLNDLIELLLTVGILGLVFLGLLIVAELFLTAPLLNLFVIVFVAVVFFQLIKRI